MPTLEEITSRLEAAQSGLRRAQDAFDAAKRERDTAVCAARLEGWTYARLAGVLGVTRARAQQLAERSSR